MKVDILTLFPEFTSYLTEFSILSRAVENKHIEVKSTDIRDYTLDKHKKVDDYSYGGGPGMVMSPQPLIDAIKDVSTKDSHVVFMSPRGEVFDQKMASNLAKKEHLVILCGHYEGIDQRVIDNYVDAEISIGDYILTGGELPAMVVIDTVARLIPDVLGNDQSADIESFNNYLLEYDQYTRPQDYKGMKVPEVLLSGNHKLIDEFRQKNAEEITKRRRPDLYKKYIEDKNRR